MAYLEGSTAQQPTKRLAPNDECQVIFLRECGNHFAGTGSVLVNEEDDSAMKATLPEALSVDKELFRQLSVIMLAAPWQWRSGKAKMEARSNSLVHRPISYL